MSTITNFSQAINAYQAASKAVSSLAQSSMQSTSSAAPASAQPSFSDLVGGALMQAKTGAYKAEAISTQGLLGKADITDVITAVSNAELSLNTVVSIRDRMINAYQDIIKMPI